MSANSPRDRSQPSKGLQNSKLRAEIAKLKLEIDAMKNPLKRFTSWVPIVIALVSVFGIVLQWQASNLKAERAAFEAARELAVVQDDLSAKKQKLHEYRVKLLKNVVDNLDKTSNAVLEYGKDWRQVTVLRDSNRAVDELLGLSLELGLLPADLTDDFVKLRDHYREWFDLYRLRFPNGIPGPHDDLVFVGTFPEEANHSIRECLKRLQGGADDCSE